MISILKRNWTKSREISKISLIYRESSTFKKSDKYTVKLNICGTGAPGHSASICLSTPTADYLFNAGEGCYRSYLQSNETTKIDKIFITQNKWDCISGVLTMISSIYEKKKTFPGIYGPHQLYNTLQRIFSLSSFSAYDFSFIKNSCQQTFFEDDVVRIDFVPISVDNKKVRKNSEKIENPLPRDDHAVVVYLCELKPCKHKTPLNPKNDIKNVNHQKPIHLMILDIPTFDHLWSLAENQQLKEYAHRLAVKKKSLDVIIHFSPKKVSDLDKYQSFISIMKPKHNLHLDERNELSRLKSIYNLQAHLNRIDDQVHPSLGMMLDASSKICDLNNDPGDSEGQSSQLFSTYYLRNPYSIICENGLTNENMLNIPSKQCVDRGKTYPKIVFFGTGSGMASPHRNNTSILVHTTYNSSILLDCGSGTCGQIYHFYGRNAPHIFKKIKSVFVSHMHVDHFLGLIELVRMRKKYLNADREPLILFGPKAELKSWLFFYDTEIEAIHDDLTFIANDSLMKTDGLSARFCKKIGVQSLVTCRVPHFERKSHAISMRLGKFKLTFSGDTPPSDELVQLGRGSDLLIHEATYPDQFEKRARIDAHSTLLQAIEQSKRMEAKYTILTHFSRRYGNKVPFIDTKIHPNIGIAFDFMEIIEQDLPKLSLLCNKYQKVFGCY